MADLEGRVDKLEERVAKLEIDITKSLGEIKTDLNLIKGTLKGNSSEDDLKNELIKKDVKANGDRITKLENNQSKLVWTVILAVLAIIGEAAVYYIQNKP